MKWPGPRVEDWYEHGIIGLADKTEGRSSFSCARFLLDSCSSPASFLLPSCFLSAFCFAICFDESFHAGSLKAFCASIFEGFRIPSEGFGVTVHAYRDVSINAINELMRTRAHCDAPKPCNARSARRRRHL